MSSSVFYRFKSQKEPKRITFDGTGISVFELKREIILDSRLGDGTDFELILSTSDSNEEYDDDTSIIPRSSTVIAKRLPAARHGKGGAARYVSGKMPSHAKNSHRAEPSAKSNPSAAAAKPPTMPAAIGEGQTEEERMSAILRLGSEQWTQQKQEMASATPVFRAGGRGKPGNVPDRPLPPGYVCYRCGQKGHWIQECPTNDDPNWENQRRLKRTTGIPKSFLKTVEKPADVDGNAEAPAGVMLNGEGEWVVVEPDKASWEQFQAKASKSAAAQQQADIGKAEIRERGLECPIDKRLFLEPTKTPCCETTFCNDCITNALLDSDLQCPHCKTEGVLIDDLKPDTDMSAKIREWEDEQAKRLKPAPADEPAAKAEGEEGTPSESPKKSPEADEAARPGSSDEAASKEDEKPAAEDSTDSPKEGPKKRKASQDLDHDRKSPAAPAEAAASDEAKAGEKSEDKPAAPVFPPELEFMNQSPFSNSGMMPNANAFSGPGMGMNMMGMNPMLMQMMMMNNMNPMNGMGQNGMGQNGMGQNWQGPSGGGFQQQGQGRNNNFGGQQIPTGPRAMNQQRPAFNNNNFNNGNNFNGNQAGEESAYFRQPVNQRRNAGRRNAPRPPNFREI